MPVRPEAGGFQTDAPSAVVKGLQLRKDNTALIRRLAGEFDATRERIQAEAGDNQRIVPYALRATDMTVAKVDSIAELLKTHVSSRIRTGSGEHSLTVPKSGDGFTFFTSGPKDADDPLLNLITVAFDLHAEGSVEGDNNAQLSADGLVVVRGDSSVSFVKRGFTSQPRSYAVITVTPFGSQVSSELEDVLLRHPVHEIHRTNLAKALTVLDPELENS